MFQSKELREFKLVNHRNKDCSFQQGLENINMEYLRKIICSTKKVGLEYVL